MAESSSFRFKVSQFAFFELSAQWCVNHLWSSEIGPKIHLHEQAVSFVCDSFQVNCILHLSLRGPVPVKPYPFNITVFYTPGGSILSRSECTTNRLDHVSIVQLRYKSQLLSLGFHGGSTIGVDSALGAFAPGECGQCCRRFGGTCCPHL